MKIIFNREKGGTVGIDLGDKKHALCVLDNEGKIIDERSMVNSRQALQRLPSRYPIAMVAFEVGSHSP